MDSERKKCDLCAERPTSHWYWVGRSADPYDFVAVCCECRMGRPSTLVGDDVCPFAESCVA